MPGPKGKNKGKGNGTKKGAPPTSAKPTQAQQLLALAEGIDLFNDQHGEPFATVPVGEEEEAHLETLPLTRDNDFRRWLERRFWLAHNRTPGDSAVREALNILAARARFDGKQLNVHFRIGAGDDGDSYLDLGRPCWDTIRIRPGGWEWVTERPPLKFRRTRAMRPLPLPNLDGTLDELKDFININDYDWPLVVAWMTQAFRPRGPYPILCLHGAYGTAKTTTARRIQGTIDPNAGEALSPPEDAKALVLHALHRWVLFYDNLSWLPQEVSDGLCRLATRGSLAVRQLYTNAGEFVFQAQRPVILTGINAVATQADLLSRCLVLELPSLPTFQSEREQDAAFEQARASILGGLLNATAAALAALPSIAPQAQYRLPDFIQWGQALEKALGWKQGTFLAAYERNCEDADSIALSDCPVFDALCKLVPVGAEWDGSPTDLLKELGAHVEEKVTKSRAWPQAPNSLSKMLKRLATPLRRQGITPAFYRKGDVAGTRTVRISRTTPPGKGPSEAPEATEEPDDSNCPF
jgi:hypothetical protein